MGRIAGKTIVATLAATALTVGAIWATRTGWALPQPIKEPISIREDSARGTALAPGRTRSRYFFVGGGPRRGK